MSLAVFDWRETRSEPALDRIEASLIGSLMAFPWMMLLAEELQAREFKSRPLGLIFETAQAMVRFDGVLVARRLEERKAPIPEGFNSWLHFIADCMDHGLVDDETVVDYVACIKEGAARRKAAERRTRER